MNDGGNSNNRVIKPCSLANSMMFNRISVLGPDHMPPLAIFLVNTQAVALLIAWITNDLPLYQSFGDWQVAHFGSSNAPNAALLADPDGDGAVNYLEYLTGTDPLQGADFWSIGIGRKNSSTVEITCPHGDNRGFEVQGTTNPVSCSALNVIGNEPFFSVSNRTGEVDDLVTNAAKFYRMRVYEP